MSQTHVRAHPRKSLLKVQPPPPDTHELHSRKMVITVQYPPPRHTATSPQENGDNSAKPPHTHTDTRELHFRKMVGWGNYGGLEWHMWERNSRKSLIQGFPPKKTHHRSVQEIDALGKIWGWKMWKRQFWEKCGKSVTPPPPGTPKPLGKWGVGEKVGKGKPREMEKR